MEGIIEPIYAKGNRCTNAGEVIKSILKKYPNECLGTLANRGNVVTLITMKEWVARNSARGTNMKMMYESIIRDYDSNEKNKP
jgi:hypothetical protein